VHRRFGEEGEDRRPHIAAPDAGPATVMPSECAGPEGVGEAATEADSWAAPTRPPALAVMPARELQRVMRVVEPAGGMWMLVHDCSETPGFRDRERLVA